MTPDEAAAAMASADGYALVLVREGRARVITAGVVTTDAPGELAWETSASGSGAAPAAVTFRAVRAEGAGAHEGVGAAEPPQASTGGYDYLWGATIREPVSGAATESATAVVVAALAETAAETVAAPAMQAEPVAVPPGASTGVQPGVLAGVPQLSARLSTGQVFGLDRPLVFGRSPAPRQGRLAEALLVAVPSPQSDISRNHLAVWREEETLLARDLGSTNGTLLRRPDRAPARVGADAPTLVRAGDVYDLGEGVTLTIGGPQ